MPHRLSFLPPAAVAENSSKQQQQQRRQQEQQQPDGRLEQLRLTERDFRQAISLLRGSQELPEEPLEELDAQERR
jgi:CRISPR/Cas system-associated protein endoribonuclease Cas2